MPQHWSSARRGLPALSALPGSLPLGMLLLGWSRLEALSEVPSTPTAASSYQASHPAVGTPRLVLPPGPGVPEPHSVYPARNLSAWAYLKRRGEHVSILSVLEASCSPATKERKSVTKRSTQCSESLRHVHLACSTMLSTAKITA